MPTFDAASLLAAQGLRATGAVSKGVYTVEGDDGTSGTLDLNEMLRAQKIDPKGLDFEVNSPDSALDVSPLGLLDRGKLAMGNAKGKLGYLKNKFEDVKYDKDKGLVVRNNGMWQAVDPSGLGGGDAWDMTKELAKDLIDVSDVAASASLATGGAALGGAAGLGVGSIPGAMGGAAAGGALAETIRTSLGRLVGTYEATPQEQLQDIGIEALLNLGGEGVAIGAKATLGGIAKAFKGLSSGSTETVKNMLSETLGKVSGAGPQATRTMMDQTDAVIKEIAQAKGAPDMVGALRDQQIKVAEEILHDAPKALTKQFGMLKSQLISDAASMPKTDIGALASNALTGIEEAGLLKRTVDGSGKTIFKVMDDETAINLRNQGKAAAILAPNVQAELQPIVNQLNKFTRLGEFEGPKAAATLMDLKKTINDVYRDMVSPSTSPSVRSLLDDFKSRFAKNIGEAFDKGGLTNQYMSTVNIYQKYADAVNVARKMAMQDTGSEQFVKKLVSDSGANRTLKDLAQDLATLLGPEGSEKINSITTKEAAKAFSSWMPRTGLAANVGIGASIAAAPATGGLSLAGIAATAPKSSLYAVQYGQKGLKFLQSMSPSQRLSLLKDPEALGTFLRTTMTSGIEQERMTEQLTQQAAQAAGVQQ